MEITSMSFMADYIKVLAFGQFLLGWAFVIVGLLFAVKWTVQLLKTPQVIEARIWAGTQFRSSFVLPDVKPLGRKGKFFWSWYIRIVSDLTGLAALIIAASLLLDVLSPSGQMSFKLYLIFSGLAAFYFLSGCGLMVQGRKEQKRISGDNDRAPLDISG
ncbi:hypothetical protein RMR21_024120 (plasmid) [Agrobacterium sp. rho-8.1]|nr:hypothetical protein [Agrobacterium sp. rho-8.1]